MRLTRTIKPAIAAFALLASGLAAFPALSQDTAIAQEEAGAVSRNDPQLVLAISVDQFSADLFAQYREHFSGGFARLLSGAVFPQGYQSHAATETCPGHSTILTGAHPSRTGIVANNWFVPGIGRDDKQVYCAEDETDPASTSSRPVVSPGHLKVPTLGDLLKRANPKAKNVAVSAKDRAAVMMSGHDADAAYWWSGDSFATYRGRAPSPAAENVSAAVRKLAEGGAPELPLPQWCTAADRAVPVADRTIGTYRFALNAGELKALARSPRIDAATGELAIRLVDEEGLGRDAVTDVLSVSFSATDYVGHMYGSEGAEMCIQLAQLDATLGKLFAALDERGIDYVAVLTADHGGFDAPERQSQHGNPQAQRMSPGLTIEALSREMMAKTGIRPDSGDLLYGGVQGDIYFAAGLSAKQQGTLTKALTERLAGDPQVAAIYKSAELSALPMPDGAPQDWTMAEKVRASFDPDRSGQMLVMLKRGVVPIPDPGAGSVATHGSPWDYDRRVPILFWRKGLAGFEQPAPVETVDIAPTLAAVVGMAQPQGTWDGRCLDIDGGAGDTCAR